MRILVIEDEHKTANYLRKGLQEQGYTVVVCSQGESGLQEALSHDFDLVILDVMLPKREGWPVLTGMRRGGKTTPVLFLTARDAILDRVKGLELGADDYLVKPFAFAELLARMRTVLRRAGSRSYETLRIGDLEIDFPRQRAARTGQRLDLTPKEFGLLSLLARRTGEVLTRKLIAEQIWDMHCESDSNVVDVHIRRLRAKVDDAFKQKLIHTVRGVGYVLEERP